VFPLVCLVASEFRYSPRCHVLVDCWRFCEGRGQRTNT
jgi:hypothetical protein